MINLEKEVLEVLVEELKRSMYNSKFESATIRFSFKKENQTHSGILFIENEFPSQKIFNIQAQLGASVYDIDRNNVVGYFNKKILPEQISVQLVDWFEEIKNKNPEVKEEFDIKSIATKFLTALF